MPADDEGMTGGRSAGSSPGDPAGEVIRERFGRAVVPADPAGAYEQVVEKKVARRVRRRAGTVALAVVVVAGTAGGTYGLIQIFGSGGAPLPPAASSSTGFTNGLIAFVSSGRIQTVRPDGSMQRAITPVSLEARDPAWSPNGAQIAFAALDSGGDIAAPTSIYVMNADGSERRIVVGGNYIEPAWSADGRSLFFVETAAGHGVVYEVGLDGGPIIQVADLKCQVEDPAVSNSGRLAVRVKCGGASSIEVMDQDGGRRRTVPGTEGATAGPAWSPDGSTLLFGRARARTIETVTSDGSDPRTLRAGPYASRLSYAPDGMKILVSQISLTHEGGPHVFVMNADGSRLTPMIDAVADEAVWQPIPAAGVPSPSVSTTPSPSAVTPSWSPTPTPSPSGSPPASCSGSASKVEADFDGDGLSDTATVHCSDGSDGGQPGWTIDVEWGHRAGNQGPAGSWPLPHCSPGACAAVASIPMNDGSNALVLEIDEGASTRMYVLLNVFPSEAGPQEYVVAEPGAPGFPAGAAAFLPDGGSVTHMDFFRCQGGPYGGGGDMATIVSTSAVLSQDQTTYTVTETVLAHGPNPGTAEVIVVSQEAHQVAFDAFDPAHDVTGEPCWSGSP
jgi:hypothetical protein